MTLELMPEFGVEIIPDIPYLDLRERAEAACRSILLLEEHGLEVQEPNEADAQVAATLTTAYANSPHNTSVAASNMQASSLTPASLKSIRSYLDEYGRAVVTHAIEVRHMVTNRLLEESQNPDPRIRIRALELLGKHSDVGLFTDRSEVTITHQSTDELKARLRAKLQRLVQKPELATDAVEIGGDVIDVDAEMGLSAPKPTESLQESVYTLVDSDRYEPKPESFDD
jgi:antitoxin component HigA of HigAB toxin-antitoxin module